VATIPPFKAYAAILPAADAAATPARNRRKAARLVRGEAMQHWDFPLDLAS
jgi:hypothetical protein